MKRRSDKRRREDEEDSHALSSFAAEFGACWICGDKQRLEIHHIAGRNGRERNCRANLFRCCQDCHRKFTDNAWLPTDGSKDRKRYGILVALAYKRLCDPHGYDREVVLAVWGKANSVITESDVLWECQAIRRDRGIGTRPWYL